MKRLSPAKVIAVLMLLGMTLFLVGDLIPDEANPFLDEAQARGGRGGGGRGGSSMGRSGGRGSRGRNRKKDVKRDRERDQRENREAFRRAVEDDA